MGVTVDVETKSYADLKAVGPWAYSEDPTTDVICVCYGIDDQPIQEWWPGKDDYVGMPRHGNMPKDLYMARMMGHVFEAHNAAFEYSIWHNVLAKKYGWLVPYDHAWRDTMAVACYYALPPALDRLGKALGYRGKDPEGSRLITKYSKLHLKTAKTEIPDVDFFKFVDYCKEDVKLEQAISDELGDLPERELRVFLLDMKVNKRGLYLDVAGIKAATAVVEHREEELNNKFAALTKCDKFPDGLRPTQRDKVTEWFADNGLVLDNMQADYLNGLMDDKGDAGEAYTIPPGPCRDALRIRLEISKASTKKLDAMARQVGSDNRARFQTRYHGAGTGRNTGSGFQPLNLSRGYEKMDPDQLVRDIMYGDPSWLDMCYGDAMDAVSKASRHWIMAQPGNKIVSGDFVSIEAVILACLSGEEWKIEAFRRKEPIYERTADKIYQFPAGTVTKDTHPSHRQDGKVCELAFGYQGALNAWLNFDDSGRHSDEAIVEFCKAWRREHPEVVKFWAGLEYAAIDAVRHPGHEKGYREIGFETVDEWLSMILPDGKRIWYRDPIVKPGMPQWHSPSLREDCRDGTCECKPRSQLTYMAQKMGQWTRTYTYGGKLTENAVQATSRQLLIPAAMRAEAAGYPVILTVYDEVVCEVPKDFGSKKEFEDIMRECPGDWAKTWPIGVDAWIGERYRK
jgi:DNA polymerase